MPRIRRASRGTYFGRAEEVMASAKDSKAGQRKLMAEAADRNQAQSDFWNTYVYTPEVRETMAQTRAATERTVARTAEVQEKSAKLREENAKAKAENERLAKSNFEQEEHTRSRISMARKKYGRKFEKAMASAERGNRRYNRYLASAANLSRFNA